MLIQYLTDSLGKPLQQYCSRQADIFWNGSAVDARGFSHSEHEIAVWAMANGHPRRWPAGFSSFRDLGF